MKKPSSKSSTRDASLTIRERAACEPAFAEALLEEAVLLSTDEPEIARSLVAHVGSLTPSTALLNKMIGENPGYRMLTPIELDLLRKSKREIGERIRAQRAAQEPKCF